MTLYEMLDGKLPWGDELDLAGVLMAKQAGNIPRPVYEFIPLLVADAIMACLSSDRQDRPANVGTLREVLEALEGEEYGPGTRVEVDSAEKELRESLDRAQRQVAETRVEHPSEEQDYGSGSRQGLVNSGRNTYVADDTSKYRLGSKSLQAYIMLGMGLVLLFVGVFVWIRQGRKTSTSNQQSVTVKMKSLTVGGRHACAISDGRIRC